MQIELRNTSQAKLEDILEQLEARYDIYELAPEDLLDALLDIGVDIIVTQTASPSITRDKLISLCSHKLASRS